MRCQKCGQKIEENSRYCSFCGASQTTLGEEPDATTEKNRTWIWVGIAVGILLIALVIGLCIHFTARNESVEESWQSQYDLGMRFLSDGDYEQAIIAFEASIALEPYHADVYLALADAYIGNGQSEQARETLEKAQDYVDDERIAEKLKEPVQEDTAKEPEEETMEEEPFVRLARINHYDTYGELSYWNEYVYDDNNQIVKEIIRYSEDDNGYTVYEYSYDGEGRLLNVQYIGYDKEGNVQNQLPFPLVYYIYNDEGKLIEEGGGEGDSSNIIYTYEGEKIVSAIGDDGYGVFEYQYFYDDSGLLTEKTETMVQSYWEDEIETEEQLCQYHYKYNSEGQLIKEISETHNSQWGDTTYTVNYSYVPLFVIIDTIIDYEDEESEYFRLSMYDSEGHSIIELELGDDPELIYDEDGYLIQAVTLGQGSTEFIYETVTTNDIDESEALENTDESEFLSLYSPVLDMFYRNVQNGWQDLNLEDSSIDSWEDPLSPNSVSYLFYWSYSGIESLSDVGYAIIDIDGNGTPELLMAVMGDSEYYEDVIYNLYTYIDGDIVILASSGERFQYSLSASEGLIYEISSSSALNAYHDLYKINYETGKLEVVEAVVLDEFENEDAPWFYATGDYYTEHGYDYSMMESITQEEALNLIERIEQVVPFEMTPLSEYTPTNA